MKIRLKLFLNKTRPNGTITFADITDTENFATTYVDTKEMVFFKSALQDKLTITYTIGDLDHTDTLVSSAINQVADHGNYVIFSCDYDTIKTSLLDLLIRGVVEVISVENKVIAYYYDLLDATNVVNKTLTIKGYILMTLKDEVNILTPTFLFELDSYPEFNYIYVPELKRYYYVDTLTIVRNKLYRISCRIDVLKTYNEDILEQSAFVSRSSDADYIQPNLVDVRKPLEDVMEVTYEVPTMTSVNIINTDLDFNIDTSPYERVILSTMSDSTALTTYKVYAPIGSDLPEISFVKSQNERWYFLDNTSTKFNTLMKALHEDDRLMSYVNALIWIPFDPYTPFLSSSDGGYITGIKVDFGKYSVSTDGVVYDHNSYPSGVTLIDANTTRCSASPYFVIADFTLSGVHDNFMDYEPYTYYELYVPFASWVRLDPAQVLNHRLIVYYTMDLHTGMGTAFIYDMTKKQLVWSQSCQIGIKMDITSSNANEITKQKQALELNMMMGLLSSALTTAGGIATKNPVVAFGGVLSGAKAITSAVNQNSMLFQKGQVSYGSGDGCVHAPDKVILRRTSRKEITLDSPTTYYKLNGSPINQYMDLDDIASGNYIEVGEIKYTPVNQTFITLTEINEIERLLKDGVIL